jgi:hypothetical protein
MTKAAEDQIIGRLAILEFIMIEALAIIAVNMNEKEAIFATLKKQALAKVDQLPADSRKAAIDSIEVIFSSALATSQALSKHLQ